MTVLRIFLYLNTWISLAAGLQAFVWAKQLYPEKGLIYSFMIFGGTLFAYNFHRFLKHRIQLPYETDRQNWIRSNRSIVLLTALSGGALALYIAFEHFISFLFYLGVAATATLIYSGFRSGIIHQPRQFHLLKSGIVGANWAFLCVFIPARINEKPVDILGLTEVFMLVFALALVFDIRDYEQDGKTMPGLAQLLKKRSIVLLSFGIGGMMILAALQANHFALSLAATGVIASGLLLFLNRKKIETELLYSLGTDGLLILHAAIVLALL